VHGLLIRLVARLPVLPFFRGIVDALMVAFSTASSSATLPVAMRVAGQNLGIGKPVFMTVLPLGAAIGKDGTAMYVGLLSLFSLQALGVDLAPGGYLIVLLTAHWLRGRREDSSNLCFARVPGHRLAPA
jgi:Na+/H+-dicarboxylate symporter